MSSHQASSSAAPAFEFSSYQKLVIGILIFLQFTIILDFMIMSPMGALLMPALNITPAQFGWIVSAYAFSAGVSGFLAAGFADRFDRKKLLLFFYAGFIGGTLFCALAPNYYAMLIARMVTGLFGGVIGSIVMAITTDLFPYQARGRVMGFLQTAFAASQVIGIPLGLYLSTLWGWHMPFILIVVASVLVGILMVLKLRPIDEHLKLKQDKNAIHHLWTTLTNSNYTLAFVSMALMSTGGFMLMPFGSAFAVNNLKITMEKLPYIYLVTGVFTLFIGPLVGKASDSFGKLNVFLFGAASTIVTVIYYTNMGESTFIFVVFIYVVLFCSIFSRIIPSQAMMSAIPTPENRGSFMSVMSSLQQISGGVASAIAGMIVIEAPDKKLLHFDNIGYILVVTAIITMYTMYKINQKVETSVKN